MLDGRVARKTYGGTLLASLPRRLPAHRAAGGRRRVLGPARAAARRGARRSPPPRRHERLGALRRAPTCSGSIPFGVAGRPRQAASTCAQVGSGNIGATNVARALGKGWAIAVLPATPPRASCRFGSGSRLALSPAARSRCAGGAGHRRPHVHGVPARPRRQGRRHVAGRRARRCRRSSALIGFGVYAVAVRGHAAVVAGLAAGRLDVRLAFVLRSAAAPPARRPSRSAAPCS